MSDDRPDRVGSPDDIAALIRLAGRRPGVSPDRSERVKAAALDQWRHEVRKRWRYRRLWTFSALAAAAVLILTVSIGVRRFDTGAALPLESTITVETLNGGAWIDPVNEGAHRQPLEALASVPMGAAVETSEGGRLSLRRPPAYSVRLDVSTRIRVLSPDLLALDRGAVYVDSGRSGGTAETAPLTIQTPLGTIQHLGTQFEVRVQEGSVRLRVREGLVRLDDGRQVHEVSVASQLTLDETGSVTILNMPTHGPEWNWMGELHVVPDLSGLKARAFLDWVARERGWRLRFDDEDLARAADETVLGGSAERLTLEQALDAVLPTCGMAYRIENGDLIITPAGTIPLPK